jgi:hypothetical protein
MTTKKTKKKKTPVVPVIVSDDCRARIKAVCLRQSNKCLAQFVREAIDDKLAVAEASLEVG